MTQTVSINNNQRLQLEPLSTPERLLLGPGPSNAHPAVLQAMNTPPLGHLDPAFLAVMDEIQSLLRYVWQTENPLTIAVSGTGTAAMEATIANVVEPGDVVLVGVIGYFGNRLADMAGRYGADVRSITKPWGQVFSLDELRTAVQTHRPTILALVHAETSTGACQPLEGVGELCREFGCLLLIDTVTSLGGVPIFLDEWGVDLAYSCSQKGLGCPPGASPFTMSPRAVEKLQQRRTKVANWYLDMTLLYKYWGSERVYHHTAPINMYYALREALRLIAEEGVENSWRRHQENVEYLWQSLENIGLSLHVQREYRLPTLTTVRIPEGVDGKAIARQLLLEHNIEIGGGLGELAGQVWRVGLMGFNSRKENVDRLIEALQQVLPK
ncbi:alanine--glyoxylate aminotransferase family protein [Fischerella thermalis]|jgi:alanine-glyoxylate transaminase/serine-glyoxylate transaminase/serine-pyruvate transaminase|uniref:Serine--pyruvate transaminase n=1 Tax=Fischerella thermalis JSC-11 TaxID=741277 RepID=G6G0C1_9CYAN|nr:alanine--glyoxylate aminotransferase family protein [Fischerella thermalis]PLZ95607.1 alanine--glyoxylate aminotransferase family protein [Fischerella thermalis CCMEE 5328]PMB11690.1 alanine--glyoxylate aminotransferase family protein [Fischerella thermalis CCMEE 5273]EHC08371.1 Serine--pyruvate transaminase [Fischerella thermalis JSC-11]MBF1991032.1 alanine--glyoxylate aminotransferase family protein [Fischerella thermalis M58_A2018_009]MBF2060297.1 alanine--glyoxylate aminotransferase fam